MKNTRYYDLGKMEEEADKGIPGAKEALERVYRQTKNTELESLRHKLIEAVRRNDHQLIAKLEQAIKKVAM